ncbi:hypothetical protein HQ585_14240 [candidate division KSB1 bacterium]|nr:hypothetical protein [candidate division KSB1 bacterium]
MKKISHHLLILSFILFGITCNRKPVSDLDNPILATIDKKTITIRDFRGRAELTNRPGNIKTRNAVLNNLIVEKLLAMEAGDTCELAMNPVFQARIQGIREQNMREALYEEVALNTIQLNSEELNKTYDLSKRVYELAFFTINNPSIVHEIEARLEADPGSHTEIFNEIQQKWETGIQTIKYRDPEHDLIHTALFSESLGEGQVIGPIHLENTQVVMMKVTNVKIHPVIGPEDQAIRLKQVEKKMTGIRAREAWNQYKAELMSGKNIRFYKESFDRIVKLYQTNNPDPNALEDLGNPSLHEERPSHLNAPTRLDEILEQPFFTVGNALWTVGDFKNAIKSHPLVYDHKIANSESFHFHYKKAVVDLIVDHFLNQEAYKRNLDKIANVNRKGEQWADSYLAKYQLNTYLEKMNLEELKAHDPSYRGPRILNEYIFQLKEKHKDRIQINTDALNQIPLTNTPIFAYQRGMPYPTAVPPFPNLTSTDTLIF